MVSLNAILVVGVLCLTQAFGTPVQRNVETSHDLAPLKKATAEAFGNYLLRLNRVGGLNSIAMKTVTDAIGKPGMYYKKCLPQLPGLCGLSSDEQFSTLTNCIYSNDPVVEGAMKNLQAQLKLKNSLLARDISALRGTAGENNFNNAVNNVCGMAVNITNSGISLETGDPIPQIITAAAPQTVQNTVQSIVSASDVSTTNAAPQSVENTDQSIVSVPDVSTTNAAPQSVENTVQSIVNVPDVSTTNAAPQSVENTDQSIVSAAVMSTTNVATQSAESTGQSNAGAVDLISTTNDVLQTVQSADQSVTIQSTTGVVDLTTSTTAPQIVTSAVQSVTKRPDSGSNYQWSFYYVTPQAVKVPAPTTTTTTKKPTWFQKVISDAKKMMG